MNLIQIQDDLRAMPMQVLQQYANGSNPAVPPYLALGVLQEKQAMQQRMGMQQGAAQGEMPTVKEKVEQSAGLMGLMQGKQQQAAQQQASASARAPGPVPGNIRPAEGQPEPTAMRRGGIVGLPSNLNLASGGIVAFQAGGPSTAARLSDPKVRQLLEQLRKAGVPEDRIAQVIAQQLKKPETDEEYRRNEAARTDDGLPPRSSEIPLESIDPAVKELIKGARVSETYPDLRGSAADRAKTPPAPPGVGQTPPSPPAAEQKPAAPATPMAAPPKGLPQLNLPQAPASETQQMLMEALKNKPTQMSMEDFLKQQRQIQVAAGTDTPYGQETRKGLEALQAQYESTKPSEMQDTIRMLSRAAQYKRGTGLAPAYLQGIDERRAADLKMAKSMLEARAGLEKGAREEAVTRETGFRTGFGDAQKRFSDEQQNRLTNLASARGQEVEQARAELSARVQMYGADRSYEAAMAQLNAAERRADTAEKRATIDAIKVDIQAATAEMKALPPFGDPTAKARRAELQAKIDGLSRALQEAGDVKLPPPPAGGDTKLPPGVTVKKVNP